MTKFSGVEIITRSEPPTNWDGYSTHKGQLYLDSSSGTLYKSLSKGWAVDWEQLKLLNESEFASAVADGISENPNLVIRDEYGRADVNDPIDPMGIANKQYVDGEFADKVDGKVVKTTSVLAPWFSALNESPATAKIALVGDSTRDSAAAGLAFHNSLKSNIAPGSRLEGMVDANVLNFGVNGGTIEAITTTVKMAALTAAAPNLVEFSMGINNIRATAQTVDSMEALLVAGVEKIRAAVPGVPLVGSIPNPFLTTADAGNYVTPNSEAAAKSAVLRAAYLRLVDRWPDVLIRDTASTFGLVSTATSPYMVDQIHPNSAGTNASTTDLVSLIGRLVPPSRARQIAARASNPYDPWTIYGREVEDLEQYVLVAEGGYGNSGAGSYIDFSFPYSQAAKTILNRDLIELPDGQVFMHNSSAPSTPGADITRLLNPAVPANSLVIGRGTVKVWRRKRPVSVVQRAILADPTHGYKRVGWVATASTTSATASQRVLDIRSGSVDGLVPTENASAWEVLPGDKLYIDGLQATDAVDFLTLGTGNTIGVNVSDLRLSSVSQVDRSSLVGRMAVLVGPARVPNLTKSEISAETVRLFQLQSGLQKRLRADDALSALFDTDIARDDIPSSVVWSDGLTSSFASPVQYRPAITGGTQVIGWDSVLGTPDPNFYFDPGVFSTANGGSQNLEMHGDLKPGGGAQAATWNTAFEFVTSATDAFEMGMYDTGAAAFLLEVGGIEIGYFAAPSGLAAGKKVTVTFPVARARHIRISGFNRFAYLWMKTGHTITKPTLPRRLGAIVGDSYIGGAGGPTSMAGGADVGADRGATQITTYAPSLLRALGVNAPILTGIGGTGFVAMAPTSDYISRAPILVGWNPKVLVTTGSINDPQNGTGVQAAVEAYLAATVSIPERYVTTVVRVGWEACNAAIRAGVAAHGNNVKLVDVEGIMDGAENSWHVNGTKMRGLFQMKDNSHPSLLGHKFLLRQIFREILAVRS